MKTLTILFSILFIGSVSMAAPSAFYTDSGFGTFTTSNAQDWSGSDKTKSSVIFETFIDFTSDADNETDPVVVFDLGADASGSGVILIDNDIHFVTGGGKSNTSTFSVTGAHGMTAGDSNVQIVTGIEFGAGTGGTDIVSLYVAGSLIQSAEYAMSDDWAGAYGSELGVAKTTSVFQNVDNGVTDGGGNVVTSSDVSAFANYPTTGATIEFAAYELGVGDNTLNNIVIPEPSTLMLLGIALGSVVLFRRKK